MPAANLQSYVQKINATRWIFHGPQRPHFCPTIAVKAATMFYCQDQRKVGKSTDDNSRREHSERRQPLIIILLRSVMALRCLHVFASWQNLSCCKVRCAAAACVVSLTISTQSSCKAASTCPTKPLVRATLAWCEEATAFDAHITGYCF